MSGSHYTPDKSADFRDTRNHHPTYHRANRTKKPHYTAAPRRTTTLRARGGS